MERGCNEIILIMTFTGCLVEGHFSISNKKDSWIISDEIHCDLLRNGVSHTPMAKLFPDTDRIITCMSQSKTFNMAGLMLANVIIPNKELRDTRIFRNYIFDNPISIAATQAAYTSGDAWLAELKIYLDNNFEFTRDYLRELLPEAGFRISEAAYLAWVNISKYLPKYEDYFLFFANKAGVLLEGCDLFVENSDGYIRLNLACPREMLEEGLKRICRACQGSASRFRKNETVARPSASSYCHMHKI